MNLSSDSGSGWNRRKLGGWGYMIGDASIFLHGLLDYINNHDRESAKGRMITGLGWGAGAIALAKYGKRSVVDQLDRLEHKLADFLVKENVPLDPEILKQASEEQRRSWFSKLEDFVYNHPTETLNAYYAAAATGLVYSGMKNPDRDAGKGDLFSGLTVIVGALLGIFIKEKGPKQLEREGHATDLIGSIRQKIESKPLAVSSMIFAANNYGTYQGAMAEYRQTHGRTEVDKATGATVHHPGSGTNQHRYALRFLTLGCYLTSNLLVGVGSKKNSGTPEEHAAAQEAMLQTIAHNFAQLSPAQQEYMATRTAEYLCKQKELRFEDEAPGEIASKILTSLRSHHYAPTTATQRYQQRLAKEAVSDQGFSKN